MAVKIWGFLVYSPRRKEKLSHLSFALSHLEFFLRHKVLTMRCDQRRCSLCILGGADSYDVVMENWKMVFNWSQRYDFSLDEVRVRVRVRGDIAWVTVKEFVNDSVEPLLATNCFELHNGQWFIVHHHSSPQMDAGSPDFGQFGWSVFSFLSSTLNYPTC